MTITSKKSKMIRKITLPAERSCMFIRCKLSFCVKNVDKRMHQQQTNGYTWHKHRQKIRPTFTCIFTMTSEPGRVGASDHDPKRSKGAGFTSRIIRLRDGELIHWKPLGKPFWHPNWEGPGQISRLNLWWLTTLPFQKFPPYHMRFSKTIALQETDLIMSWPACHDHIPV